MCQDKLGEKKQDTCTAHTSTKLRLSINSKLDFNTSTQRDAAELLYANGFAGIGVSLVSSSLLVFAFDTPNIGQFKRVWWGVMCVILLCRFADTIWWRTKQLGTNYNGQKAIFRFITGTYLTALMWCTYSLSVFRYTDTIEFAMIVIVVSAMAGGASTILAAHKYTAMAYAFILLGPLSIGGLLSNEDYRQLLGILGLSFCVVMILTAKKSAEFTSNAIRLKNENALLVHHMEEQVELRTEKIYELSNLDPLTGLFNRTAFLNHLGHRLEECKETNKSLALLFIDLDGFKKINDTSGHETGDQLLKQTAERLKKHCADSQLLCRWGGDEFLIAIADIGESTALQQAMGFIEHISETYVLEGNRLSVGATVGIAFYPQHATTEHKLIQVADTAMYYQKKKAPSTAGIFSTQLGKKLSREQLLRNGLTEAITKEQLRLVFQPIVMSTDNRPRSFEALLRWQLDDENIPPDEFIGIAEQYGLICKIGEWVINQACLAAKTWDPQRKIAVCVNVSMIQLQDEDFQNVVDRALSASSLDPELLHIEITESVLAENKDIILQQIKILQSKGIKVSMDDFGTGYSSLSVMQHASLNVIKIDRSFVDSLETKGLAIIDAVMHIASSLDFLVVAEGVENELQAQKLSAMGVHFQQGFYHARPMEREHVANFLLQNSP